MLMHINFIIFKKWSISLSSLHIKFSEDAYNKKARKNRAVKIHE